MSTHDIGMDLGTASVLIYIKGRGVVLREPSVVAVDRESGDIIAVGEEAQTMLGRTPEGIAAIRPLREGVISDYEITQMMVKNFLKKVSGFRLFKPNIVVCVPSGITELEERAVVDAGMESGAKRVYLIEEPVAAAIGAGIDISKPVGSMIVDIGGGTCDIAVMSLGTIVESDSIKIAGDKFNDALIRFMRRKHNLLIGEHTAEDAKINIGCVFPRPEEKKMSIRGRCLITGLPKTIDLSSSETIEAFSEVTERVIESIHGVIERTSPELIADISKSGIMLTGGGSLLWGLDQLIAQRTGIPTHIADDSISCVAYGTGKTLENLSKMHDGTLNLARRRQLKA